MDSIEMMLKKLGDLKCDTDGALKRMMNNTGLYVKFLRKFTEDKSMEELGKNIEAKNAEEAYRCAHTLKGVSANLGLDPIYQAVAPMAEKMRAGELEGASEAYAELMSVYNRIAEEILAG